MGRGVLGVGLISLTIFFEFLCCHSNTSKGSEGTRSNVRNEGKTLQGRGEDRSAYSCASRAISPRNPAGS